MDNKTQSFQFRKTKLALAVAMTVSLAACGVDGDEGSVSTSNATADASQPTSVDQAMPTGSIAGVVLDTNGMPVVGATVSVAGMTTTTDESGSYKVDDAQVTNVAGADDDTGHSAFIVVIQSPAGYASTVTVDVKPEAQVDAANNDSVGTPLTTFVDGFLAQADTAVVPKMESTVEGYLRNNTTGEPIANATMTLDFTGIASGAGSTVSPVSENQSTSGDSITVVTDATGHFMFTGVANDSTYNININGYTRAAAPGGGSTVAGTTAEGVTNWVGDINVVANASGDSKAPYVANVVGWIQQSATSGGVQYGMLNRGVDQVFTVQFSEAVNAASFNADDVLVTLGNSEYLATESVVLAEDGRSVTVTLAEALDEGDKISIFMPWADATDLAGNYFSTTVNGGDASATTAEAGKVDFDASQTAVSGKAGYLRVNLCVFIEPSSGEGTATQVVDQSAGVDGGSSALAAYSNAYIDSREDSGDGVVQQINGSDSAERLSVFRAIQGNATSSATFSGDGAQTVFTLASDPVGILSVTVGGTETAVTVSGADITFGAAPAAAANNIVVNYVASNYDDRATRVTIAFDGSATATASAGSSGVTVANNPWTGDNTVPSSASSWAHYFDFNSIDHGDYGRIKYTDDLGVQTKDEFIQVFDNAKPTTVIQDSYDLHGYNNEGTYTATVTTSGQAQYGNGGETSHAGINDVPGNPTLYIQPRHLAQKGTNGAVPARGSEFNTLTTGMVGRLGANEAPAAPAPNESSLTTFDANSTTELAAPLYDAAAIAGWTVSQDIGVGFSEFLSTTIGTPTYTGTTAISGLVVENTVDKDVDGNQNVTLSNVGANDDIEADLVLFTTADVVGMANNDNGAIMGFAGAVSDSRGNTADADSNAQVVILDAMPPMVTSATWTGTELVMSFNEPLRALNTTARNIQVWNPVDASAGGSGAIGVTTANGSLSNDMQTLTVSLTTGQANAIANAMQDGNDNEFLYNDDADATDEENHAVLAWDGIQDANFNAWSTFDDGTAPLDTRYETRAPRFLLVNGVGTFTYSVATSGYLDNDGTPGDEDGAVTFTITFTHPIDLTSPADVAVDGTLTATALGSAINAAEGGAGWSAPGGAAVGQPGVQSTLSWNTVAAADVAIIEAIFSVNDIGAANAAAGDNADAGTFSNGPVANDQAQASVSISADRRVITLNITTEAEGVRFGVTDFLFDTVVDSTLINGAQTSAGRFNWQNTN